MANVPGVAGRTITNELKKGAGGVEGGGKE